MARPGQIDHITQGLEALPELYRRDTTERYLTVYLNAYNDQEELQQQLLEALLNWARDAPVFSFVYDLFGTWFDQPRPDGFSDDEYRFILLGRVKVRRSAAELNGVLKVANYLARGGQFVVQPIVPKAWTIAFFDLGLTEQEQGLYRAMLLDTIGQQDKLELQFVTSGTAQYDSLVTTYDVGVYG